MQYNHVKGFVKPKPPKRYHEMFLTAEQVKQLLDTIANDEGNPLRRRDHCAIFLGYHFGLRIGETAMLSRETFRAIGGPNPTAYIKTLKQGERIDYPCPGCKKKIRVAVVRAGTEHTCGRCGETCTVPRSLALNRNPGPPEKEPPTIERYVTSYVIDYMSSVMQPEQEWFFEGKARGSHLCADMLRRVFNSYLKTSGLHPIYSWHSLRHGRGVAIYDRFENLVMTRDMLRQNSLKSTELYARISPQRAEASRRELEESADGRMLAANPFGTDK